MAELNKLNIEECSINELKIQIAQILSLPNDSFGRWNIFLIMKIEFFFSRWINTDVYCQGVQLIGDDKNLNDYEIENEDNLVIIPKVKMPTESLMTASAGKSILKRSLWNCFYSWIGLPGKSELHQSAKTIEISATPNEFHRVRENKELYSYFYCLSFRSN